MPECDRSNPKRVFFETVLLVHLFQFPKFQSADRKQCRCLVKQTNEHQPRTTAWETAWNSRLQQKATKHRKLRNCQNFCFCKYFRSFQLLHRFLAFPEHRDCTCWAIGAPPPRRGHRPGPVSLLLFGTIGPLPPWHGQAPGPIVIFKLGR